MEVTESQLRRMITSHALQSTAGGWRNWCQRLMWNISDLVGAVETTYGSATAAYNASQIESLDPTEAPPGAAHYWREPWPDGHVAFDLGGGGTRVLMATSFADEWWGNGAGTISVVAYGRRTGSTYLGWSRRNGANRLPILEGQLRPAIKSQEGFLMALTDDEQRRLLARVDTLHYALGNQILPALGRNDLALARRKDITASELADALRPTVEDALREVGSGATAGQIADELAKRLAG